MTGFRADATLVVGVEASPTASTVAPGEAPWRTKP